MKPRRGDRGRRGLDILQKIQKMSGAEVVISDVDFPEVREVDLKLIELARTLSGKIVTNDFNLNKVAGIHGIKVLNINELVNSLRPVALPGETMNVFILKEGKEKEQGVAYLEDGTMVVVDNSKRMIGQSVDVIVTSGEPAALAAKLDVSEAALYRHFASKAQMFEGLIEFIESSVFTLVNQITERESSGALQAQKIVTLLLQFGEKNPGMTRVMVGDALVFEHERLIARMNQFFDRVESQLRQSLRQAAESSGSMTPTVDAGAMASVITAFVVGRLQRYARSGFKRNPTEHLDAALQRLTS